MGVDPPWAGTGGKSSMLGSSSAMMQQRPAYIRAAGLSRCLGAVRPTASRGLRVPTVARAQGGDQPQQQLQQQRAKGGQNAAVPRPESLLYTSAGLYLLSVLPAAADTLDMSSPGYSQGSYVVSLGLFLVTLPGAGVRDMGLCSAHPCPWCTSRRVDICVASSQVVQGKQTAKPSLSFLRIAT